MKYVVLSLLLVLVCGCSSRPIDKKKQKHLDWIYHTHGESAEVYAIPTSSTAGTFKKYQYIIRDSQDRVWYLYYTNPLDSIHEVALMPKDNKGIE